MEEIWKDIEGYEGLYQVSNLGNVKSLKYMRTNIPHNLKKHLTPKGYYQVCLQTGSWHKYPLVHRLVYEAFVGKIPEGMQVNHINETKTDNRPENLNLMTPKENVNFGTRNERVSVGRKQYFKTLKDAG